MRSMKIECDRKVDLDGDLNVGGPLSFMRSSMGIRMLGLFSEFRLRGKASANSLEL